MDPFVLAALQLVYQVGPHTKIGSWNTATVTKWKTCKRIFFDPTTGIANNFVVAGTNNQKHFRKTLVAVILDNIRRYAQATNNGIMPINHTMQTETGNATIAVNAARDVQAAANEARQQQLTGSQGMMGLNAPEQGVSTPSLSYQLNVQMQQGLALLGQWTGSPNSGKTHVRIFIYGQ